MKRYRVWAHCTVGRCPNNGGNEGFLEFDDAATEEEIEAACKDACKDLIGNVVESGWDPVEENAE